MRAIASGLLVFVVCAITGCSGWTQPKAQPSITQDSNFAAIAARYLDGFSRFSPVEATHIGDHRHDAELDDLSEVGRNANLAWDREILSSLAAIDRSRLARANQVDAAMLDNKLRYDVWTLTKLKSWASDPLLYNDLAGGGIYNLMVREFASLSDRLRSATARLERLPAFLVQARANLDARRVPRIFAEQAVSRNPGLTSLIMDFVNPHVDELAPEERPRLRAAIADAVASIAAHQTWLEKTLLPAARGDFRVGQQLYDEHLRFALLSNLDRAEIRRRAESEIARVRAEMYKIARNELADKLKPVPLPERPTPEQQQRALEAALNLAAIDHPAADQIVPFARTALAYAIEFVREKRIVRVPDDPVEIILMPEFQRGFSVAYSDSPGPLDTGQKTLFAISPIPTGWSKAQADSFLREYNKRAIHNLTIHEAIPGHYLQAAASNRYPSKLRAVLGSGSFIEGWAVYAERVMSEAGYLGADPLMKLVQRKLYLRVVSNAILDQAIHVDGMTREQAMELMTRTTFQEEREAAGKWVRAQLSSTQLSTYFVGFQEHWDMRREAEQWLGNGFSLREYNDQVISYGSPPVRFVRALLFELPIEP